MPRKAAPQMSLPGASAPLLLPDLSTVYQDPEVEAQGLDSNPTLLLISCVTTNKILTISEPQFPNLEMGRVSLAWMSS